MPVIQISLYKGRSDSEKEGICRSIQNSIKKAFTMTHDNFHHRVIEFDRSNLFIPPGKSKNYLLIEMDFFPGRSEQEKTAMFKEIEKNLAPFSITPDDILILYREPSLENWYIRGQTAKERNYTK